MLQTKQKITVKMVCNANKNPILKKTIKTLAEQTHVKLSGLTTLKKKKKLLLSLISGPHVHKKSRDQYYFEELTAFFIIEIKNEKDLQNFNEYKKKLYQLDSSIQLKYTYLKNDFVTLEMFVPQTILANKK